MNYSKIYDALINRACSRISDGYVERHHIIPRCMGGSDENTNLVALYPDEHFLAHILLLKIHKNTKYRHQLAKAVQHMCCVSKNHDGKRITRKLYGWLKREHALAMSVASKGAGNSQFGTMWICNITTQENKKIRKTDIIPNGWIIGRNRWNFTISLCKCCNKEFTGNTTFCSKSCASKSSWTAERKRKHIQRLCEQPNSKFGHCNKGKPKTLEHKLRISEGVRKHLSS